MAPGSDAPAGAGRSSYAALEMAVGTALLGLREAAPPIELVLAGNRAENASDGVASGIIDQFASALARADHALHLRWLCQSRSTAELPTWFMRTAASTPPWRAFATATRSPEISFSNRTSRFGSCTNAPPLNSIGYPTSRFRSRAGG